MRRTIPFAALVVGLIAIAVAQEHKPLPTPAAVESGVAVFFSPDGGCTDAIVEAIRQARRTLDVQAYSFTSTPIAKAVKEAHERGVKVRVILDKSQRKEKYTSATYLFNAGVPVWIDAKHAIAHNKVMLIDGDTIITGSFNFSAQAEERNAENLLIITDRSKLAAAYAANFAKHLEHAERYQGLEAKADDR